MVPLASMHCGNNSAMCKACHAALRHLCPVCERSKINASYQCLTCNSVVSLKDYGMPCSKCGKNALCTGCYSEYGECVACDPLRDEEECSGCALQ